MIRIDRLARIALAIVFAFAGVAKLRDLTLTSKSFEKSGVPAHYSRPLARAVPSFELAVAAGLMWARTASLAAKTALAMLIVFTAFIWRNVANGRDTRCACFGQHLDSISGWRAVARNAVLIGMSSVIATPDFFHNRRRTIAKLSPAEVASLSFLTILPSLVAFEGWRRLTNARSVPLYSEVVGPRIGDPIPDAMLHRPGTESMSIPQLLESSNSNEVVFLFIDFNCSPCLSLVERLEGKINNGVKYPTYLIMQESHHNRHLQETNLMKLSLRSQASAFLHKPSADSISLITALNIRSLPCAVLVDSADREVRSVITGKEEILKSLVL